jgi:GT2 family glycosyltransferase
MTIQSESTAIAWTARGLLKLAEGPARSWTDFDAKWYVRAYPEVRLALPKPVDAKVMAYYLDNGQSLRHSPNPFFDERYFLRMHPGSAEAVRAGEAESGFDAYCRAQGRQRRPHWLFDQAFYHGRYEDLTQATLAEHGLLNGYDHFLRHGSHEGRSGSPFFDPGVYRAGLSPDEAAAGEAAGWFADCLRRLHAGGAPEPACSVYFDPVWYLRTYEAVGQAVEDGEWLSGLHHYLTNDTPLQFDPLPEFSETFYLKLYPDLIKAIQAGDFRSCYHHFLSDGVFERRTPSEAVDLNYYIDTHRSVRDDLQHGVARDAFAHFLSIGRAQGLRAAAPPEEQFTEGQAKTLFRRRAALLVPLYARRQLDFSYRGRPALSVIMVVHDRFALTLHALASLRDNFAGAIDVTVVDSGSTDETVQIDRCVRGASVLRFDMNLGFLLGSNAGLQGALADTVLFLNNDVELAHGAVQAALDRLASDPRIGAVGGKVVRTHGQLQEAGCIVWQDGATLGYLRDGSPTAPEANFVRDVDFCSGVFLMVRGDLAHELEGFAEDFAPAYYEDVDLCVRIQQAGYRVVYDPSVVVHHLEYGSASSARASEAEMSRARQTFIDRHGDYLRSRRAVEGRAVVFARSADAQQRRVLFIEDTVPLRVIGSGFVRSNDMIAVMAEIGCHVTVFPVLPHRFDLAAIYADMPDTVEVMFNKTLDDLAPFLESRAGYYDTIWVARTHNLDRVRPILERLVPLPRIVLDTEAIAALRTSAQAELSGQDADFDFDAAITTEFADAGICRGIVAVSEFEADKLRAFGFDNVSVIGHMRALAPTPRDFADRTGLLFVGAIHNIDSPNYDSLCWFVDTVLPLVQDVLGWETQLTIAGYMADGVTLDRFRDHPRVSLRGPIPDLVPLYDAHRVFVAPTRYAAGTPYKVYEAASHGLPIVASDLLCRQTGWVNGNELLAAPTSDPQLFAERIVALYSDRGRWQHIRAAALSRLAAENGRERYAEALRGVLGKG